MKGWKLIFVFSFLLWNGIARAQSDHELDSIYKLLQRNINDTTRINAYNELCWPLYSFSNIDSSIKYGQKAIDLSLRTGDSIRLMIAYRRVGIAYINAANHHMALLYEQKSYDLAQKINHKRGMASALNNFSVIYLNVSDYRKAIDYSLRSLKIQEQTGDSTSLFNTYYNLGLLYRNIDDLKNASLYCHKAYQIAKIKKRSEEMAFAFENIANILKRQAKYDSAYHYYQQSLQIFKSSNHLQGQTETYSNIGNLFSDWSRKSSDSTYMKRKALEFYNQALAINKNYQNDITAANIYGNIGFLYLRLNKPDSVLYFSSKALQFAEKLNEKGEIVFTSRVLYEAYSKKGDLKNALKYLELHLLMKDSVFNLEKQKEISQKQLKYDFEKKLIADSLKVEKERETVSLKLRQERTQRYYLYIGLILVVGFAFFMYNRFKITKRQKSIIEQKEQETKYQKTLIEEKQKEILDSISYARRIQYTLLAHHNVLQKHLSDHFIFFKPKDIVSGDFYWATQKDHLFYFAICDSTGHGVPGAFMSLLNINFLNEAINEKNITSPEKVFDYVRGQLINSISKDDQKDGFDGVILCFDSQTKELTYAAANNAPVLVSAGTLLELPRDKMPVGKGEYNRSFEKYTVKANPGDTLYIYTDGYADQFGGPKGKKFKYRQLNDLLYTINGLPLHEQKSILEDKFTLWKGSLEQVDDICVVGIKI